MNTSGQITVRQWFALPKAERQRRVTEFRAADRAMQACELGPEEDELFDELNDRFWDLRPTVPWWAREPALPHPGSRHGAALCTLGAVAALAVTVMIALSLTGCHVGWPCGNHGGGKWTNGKLYQCNDGTWE